jgi:hypothetical protein
LVFLDTLKMNGEATLPGRHHVPATFPVVVIIALSLAAPRSAIAAHNLLQNSDFPSNIASWTLGTDSGFDLSWDPTKGSPAPGSLRLSGAYQGFGSDTAEALSECFNAAPGVLLTVQAKVLAETSDGTVKCVPFVTRYEGPGCTGDRTQFGSSAPVTPTEPGAWHSVTDQSVNPAGLPFFRVSLLFWSLTGEELSSCSFDSVALIEGSTVVPVIPMTSETGSALFMGFLGLAATWLLRAKS